MSTNNRERRAAKKKARDQRRRRYEGTPRADGVFEEATAPPRRTPEVVACMLLDAGRAGSSGDTEAADRCRDLLAHPPPADTDAVRRGLELAPGYPLEQLWQHGWLPSDVVEQVRRALPPAQCELAADLVAVQIRRYSTASLHPRWQQSVAKAEVGADRVAGRPAPQAWGERHHVSPAGIVDAVFSVIAVLYTCPVLQTIVPPPGTAPARRAARNDAGRARVDPKVLARVRALLAKAESTPYPEEAEALSAKAQELMNRHALEQAVVEGENATEQAAITVRMWLDAPYVPAKSLLVSAVAEANRCTSVRSSSLDMVSIVGHEGDLDVVELLVTSLLVQANRAMLHEARTTVSGGRARSRSFRQSFLVAYAGRIGERLREAATSAQEELAADDRLLPVLTRRASAVDDTVAEVFGDLRYQSISVNDGAGWSAGRAAADAASLGLDRERVEA